jgi:hypothetical protein
MAEHKRPKQKTPSRRAATVAERPPASAGAPGAVPSGSILANRSSRAAMGGQLLAPLEADVSGEVGALAPAFGDVLSSIGNGVATSQDALDRGLVQTATALSGTEITLITDVIQELSDDGLPVLGGTELVPQTVSLINFVRPTAHEWSHVALSMDLSVGAFDTDRGMTFRKQMESDRASQVGLFFGFLGIGVASFESSSTFRSNESEFEANWAEGRVRMDAMLRPRQVDGFEPPAEVTIGPQIFIAQGSVNETVSNGVVTERSQDLVITVRKADGSVNPTVGIDIDSGPFDLSFASTDGFTNNITNASGQCKATISRFIPNALFQRRSRGTIIASLGQVQKRITLSL